MTELDFLTIEQVAELDKITIEGVTKRIRRKVYKGARKLDPTKRTSPWLIPKASYEATQPPKEPKTKKTKNRARPSRAAKARP